VMRPEDLEVVEHSEAGPYTIEGKVVLTMYLGHSRQAIVDIGGGARISISLNPRRSIGERVRIQYSPDDVLVYRIAEWGSLLQD